MDRGSFTRAPYRGCGRRQRRVRVAIAKSIKARGGEGLTYKSPLVSVEEVIRSNSTRAKTFGV